MLNITVLSGRLVETPELRNTQNGIPVASLRIAVARDFVNKEDGEDVDYFDIVAWRTNAEFICKHFTKGKMITVTGRLKNKKWRDKDGNNRTTTELQVDNAYFGESKPSGNHQSGDSYGGFDPLAGHSQPYNSFNGSGTPPRSKSGTTPWGT